MSFRTNSSQQIAFNDSFNGLTSLFSSINEEPFRMLYSGSISKLNTPANICIGALII